jgi:hypothetical protein
MFKAVIPSEDEVEDEDERWGEMEKNRRRQIMFIEFGGSQGTLGLRKLRFRREDTESQSCGSHLSAPKLWCVLELFMDLINLIIWLV